MQKFGWARAQFPHYRQHWRNTGKEQVSVTENRTHTPGDRPPHQIAQSFSAFCGSLIPKQCRRLAFRRGPLPPPRVVIPSERSRRVEGHLACAFPATQADKKQMSSRRSAATRDLVFVVRAVIPSKRSDEAPRVCLFPGPLPESSSIPAFRPEQPPPRRAVILTTRAARRKDLRLLLAYASRTFRDADKPPGTAFHGGQGTHYGLHYKPIHVLWVRKRMARGICPV
jgi:hypothetical protein